MKMIDGRISTRFILLAVLSAAMPGSSAAEQFVIANGGSILAIYETTGGGFAERSRLLEAAEWSGVIWPSWQEPERTVFFQGVRAGGSEGVGIYSLELLASDAPGQIRRISDGRLPALSPDGRNLASVDREGHLRISSLAEGSFLLEGGPEIHSTHPVVWTGVSTVAFIGKDRDIHLLDVESGDVRSLGVTDLVPAAAVSGSSRVVCVGYEGRRLVVVDTADGSSRQIQSYLGRSIGPSIIWGANGESFLMTRQTWGKLIRFSEGKDVFRMELDGSEKWIASGVALFGGFALK